MVVWHLRSYGWRTGDGIKLLQGFEISLIMRSYSLIVCLSLLSLSVGSEFLGMPIIFRLLACMFSNSSARY